MEEIDAVRSGTIHKNAQITRLTTDTANFFQRGSMGDMVVFFGKNSVSYALFFEGCGIPEFVQQPGVGKGFLRIGQQFGDQVESLHMIIAMGNGMAQVTRDTMDRMLFPEVLLNDWDVRRRCIYDLLPVVFQ